jgi:hypothetical protein
MVEVEEKRQNALLTIWLPLAEAALPRALTPPRVILEMIRATFCRETG